MTAASEPRWDAPLAEVAAYWRERPFWKELDIRLEALAPGYARLALHRNGWSVGGVRNSVNGGVLAMLAESAAQLSLRTVLEPGGRVERTQDLGISYASSAVAARTVVEARVRRVGRTALVAVEISDGDDGHLNCAARVSCLLARGEGVS